MFFLRACKLVVNATGFVLVGCAFLFGGLQGVRNDSLRKYRGTVVLHGGVIISRCVTVLMQRAIRPSLGNESTGGRGLVRAA